MKINVVHAFCNYLAFSTRFSDATNAPVDGDAKCPAPEGYFLDSSTKLKMKKRLTQSLLQSNMEKFPTFFQPEFEREGAQAAVILGCSVTESLMVLIFDIGSTRDR